MTLKLNRQNLITKIVWSTVFGRLRHYGEGLLSSQGINFAQRVYGLLQTSLMTEEYLLGLIPQIQANLVEIYAHPTLVNDGEVELRALLSPQIREVLKVNEFELTHFGNYEQIFGSKSKYPKV
jgi:hypothetical protein